MLKTRKKHLPKFEADLSRSYTKEVRKLSPIRYGLNQESLEFYAWLSYSSWTRASGFVKATTYIEVAIPMSSEGRRLPLPRLHRRFHVNQRTQRYVAS